jgi:hypothetical protein
MTTERMTDEGPDTICAHCGMRRATHIRRHHGAGPKGTEWYCRTPTERLFQASRHWTEPPDLSPLASGSGENDMIAQQIQAKDAEIARLRAALKPFADVAHEFQVGRTRGGRKQ